MRRNKIPAAGRDLAGAPRHGGRNEVRIIAGQWRGRKLRFPENAPGIRPTPDRVRETLFNWLQQVIAGSRCLDLFAGSGALGLEALSRGAAEVVFVDQDPAVVTYLGQTLALLQCSQGQVELADARRFLSGPARPFDIVFLDPPFASNALPELCRQLEQAGWLAPGGLVYLESPAAAGEPVLPESWELFRSKRAGEVGYHLARHKND
jgi:16S rRNA (guanine966-N2)-methyltransferase